MNRSAEHLDHLHLFGVSYKTADVQHRQAFSLSEHEQHALLSELKEQTDFNGFITSTCNRTEIIGTTLQYEAVLALFLDHTQGSADSFEDIGYHLYGMDAVQHLFRVGVGMESQIPGDFEIIMQLRRGFKWARKANSTNGFMEKIINQVIHASKRVKSETGFSTGATSVSYAAARYLKDEIENLDTQKIALYGLGKFGRITLDHLLGLTSPSNITLINRSDEKSRQFAEESGANFCAHDNLQNAIDQAEILVVATGADRPILTSEQLDRPQLHTVIDMAVPFNVDPSVGDLPQLTLLNVDQLSQMTREALDKRKNELPLVEAIIAEEIQELLDWQVMREQSEEINTSLKTLMNGTHSLEKLVNTAYESIVKYDETTYLHKKMQRYYCYHIRRGRTVQGIQTELSSRLSSSPSK